MNSEPVEPSVATNVASDLRSSWRPLLLTTVAFKTLAFIVLTPLLGAIFRTLIALSGRAVLSDVDLLYFFLGPAGWLCAVVAGGVWLGIVALEQSALLSVVCASRSGERCNVIDAVSFAWAKVRRVLGLTTRVVARILLVVIPFVVLLGGIYALLLTEFDINFYLKERPAEFQWAVGIGLTLAVGVLVLLLRMATDWFVALPMVLFEDVPPSDALRASTERVAGHRRRVLGWLLAWGVAVVFASSVATGLVVVVGRLVVPGVDASLHLLVLAIGTTLLVMGVANLAVNVLATVGFTAILFELFRVLGREDSRVPWTNPSGDREGTVSQWLTTGRLTAVVVIGLLVAVGAGVVFFHGVRLEDDVDVMAHRGASAAAPENTLAAIDRAIEAGADWVEIDVQETADGEVVVFHDSDFMKLSRRNLKIWDATTEDLEEIDIGSWFGPEFADQRVPTLADVLERCRGRIGVNIELKYYGHDVDLERRVSEVVDAHDMGDQVLFMSLKRKGVERMQAIRPDAKVGLLLSVAAGDPKKFSVDFLAVNASFASRRFVRRAHANGQEVFVWTVNDAATMSTMIGRGVDGLLTDEPALAKSVLEQRADLSPPERLLLELAELLGTTPRRGEQ